MNDSNTPLPPDTAPETETPPNPQLPSGSAKSLTIEQIVQHAAMQLDGLGLDEKLVKKAVVICAGQMDRVAASALHSVLSEHISRLSLKQVRKPRKQAFGDQSLAG